MLRRKNVSNSSNHVKIKQILQVHRWPYYKLQIPALFCEISNSRIHLRHALTLVNSKLVVYIRGGFRPTPAALFVHRPRPLPPFPRSPESKKKSSLRLRPPSPNRPQPGSHNQRNEGGVVALLAARRGQDDGAGGAAVRLARRGRYEGCGGEVKPLRSISSAIRLRT